MHYIISIIIVYTHDDNHKLKIHEKKYKLNHMMKENCKYFVINLASITSR